MDLMEEELEESEYKRIVICHFAFEMLGDFGVLLADFL
jgi:hypothetical protein